MAHARKPPSLHGLSMRFLSTSNNWAFTPLTGLCRMVVRSLDATEVHVTPYGDYAPCPGRVDLQCETPFKDTLPSV